MYFLLRTALYIGNKFYKMVITIKDIFLQLANLLIALENDFNIALGVILKKTNTHTLTLHM